MTALNGPEPRPLAWSQAVDIPALTPAPRRPGRWETDSDRPLPTVIPALPTRSPERPPRREHRLAAAALLVLGVAGAATMLAARSDTHARPPSTGAPDSDAVPALRTVVAVPAPALGEVEPPVTVTVSPPAPEIPPIPVLAQLFPQ